MKRAIYLFCAAILVITASTGCPRRDLLDPGNHPDSLVNPAIVRTPSPVFRDGKDLIVIKSIDNKPITFTESTAIVSPGVHTFQIGIELRKDDPSDPAKSYVTKADTSLVFDVDANHEYLIDAREDQNGVWVWATDVSNNYIVAGEAPRELPEDKKVKPLWDK